MASLKIGRFDQSFMFRMIRDFFLLLIVVSVAELGIRYAIVVYEFEKEGRRNVERAAEQLAADVKSVMLNSGGPIAARTVYPIFKRNLEDLGLSLAIVPSEVTIASITSKFGMEPQGIRPQWGPGRYNESTMTLTADQFCLNCHIYAKIGDVLGHVTVRGYLSIRLSEWWTEVRLSSLLLGINIITRTTVLFLLLRVRMEPLLTLRSTVAALAKGVVDLSVRARVKSDDEFGELAQDLNHFLDRIGHLIEDLDRILTPVIAVSHRLAQLSGEMNAQFEGIQQGVRLAIGRSLVNQGTGAASIEVPGLIGGVISTLVALAEDPRVPPEICEKLRDACRQLEAGEAKARDLARHSAVSGQALVDLDGNVHGFTHYLIEMAALQEKMKMVAESGQLLLGRLTRTAAA